MDNKDFDKLIILQDYINRYCNTELQKLSKVYTKNELQKELTKLFTIIVDANKLEDQFVKATAEKIEQLEKDNIYYRNRYLFVKQICDNNGIDVKYTTFNKLSDL